MEWDNIAVNWTSLLQSKVSADGSVRKGGIENLFSRNRRTISTVMMNLVNDEVKAMEANHLAYHLANHQVNHKATDGKRRPRLGPLVDRFKIRECR